jgi:hypothetical protein
LILGDHGESYEEASGENEEAIREDECKKNLVHHLVEKYKLQRVFIEYQGELAVGSAKLTAGVS